MHCLAGKALASFAADGLIEIDDNGAGLALRAVAPARNKYLFAGSDAGCERAAAAYSLVGSAKLVPVTTVLSEETDLSTHSLLLATAC